MSTLLVLIVQNANESGNVTHSLSVRTLPILRYLMTVV